MKTRITKLSLIAALVLGALAAVAVASQTVTVYSNPLKTRGQVADFHRVSRPGEGSHCGHSLRGQHMQMKIGSSTTECTYSPSVVASCSASPSCTPNFTVTARTALSKSIKKSLRKNTFLSVGVRLTGGGGLYRFDVYSDAKRWRLRRYATTQNAKEADAGGNLLKSNYHVSFINKPPKTNTLRIKILQTGGTARLFAWINNHKVAAVTESNPKPGTRVALSMGRDSGSANGAIGAFSKFLVRNTF